jgi:hypothetical protein
MRQGWLGRGENLGFDFGGKIKWSKRGNYGGILTFAPLIL